MAELDTEEERLEFKWGKKRGIGGKNKDVQFYESFTFDGEEYKLFDDVYLHNEGGGEPYIGKLIKIWENPDKSKKVKIQWFYHPSDIRDFLEGYEPRNNELFLAYGEGIGLADINPVEAVARKCNVICISEDIRNPKPSDEELKMADFVFCRFFDVGLGKILDKINGKIAGIDVLSDSGHGGLRWPIFGFPPWPICEGWRRYGGHGGLKWRTNGGFLAFRHGPPSTIDNTACNFKLPRFASGLLAWILGASIGFCVGGWKYLRDVVVRLSMTIWNF